MDATGSNPSPTCSAARGGTRSRLREHQPAHRVRTPESFARNARDALAAGFDAIKIAPFDDVGPARTPADNRDGLAKGLERTAAVGTRSGPCAG
jgi:hypothetical protein